MNENEAFDKLEALTNRLFEILNGHSEAIGLLNGQIKKLTNATANIV
jgi:hypothetical protein